jgi:hypothetical protein
MDKKLFERLCVGSQEEGKDAGKGWDIAIGLHSPSGCVQCIAPERKLAGLLRNFEMGTV